MEVSVLSLNFIFSHPPEDKNKQKKVGDRGLGRIRSIIDGGGRANVKATPPLTIMYEYYINRLPCLSRGQQQCELILHIKY